MTDWLRWGGGTRTTKFAHKKFYQLLQVTSRNPKYIVTNYNNLCLIEEMQEVEGIFWSQRRKKLFKLREMLILREGIEVEIALWFYLRYGNLRR